MRPQRIVLASAFALAVVALCVGAMQSSRPTSGANGAGVIPLPFYDANRDGVPDGNPAYPSVGDVWRNGKANCNWPMVQTPLGPRCIGTDLCPVECQ